MVKLLDSDHIKDAATEAAGDIAGTVADPKTGWQMLRSRLTSPTVLVTAAVVVAAYLAGRRSVRRKGHR